MKRHHWTFLYVPSGDGGVRTLHVSKRWAAAAAGLAGLLVLVVGILTVSYVRQGLILRDAREKERENQALLEKLTQLEQRAQTFEEQIAANFELEEQAHVLAGLGPLDETMIEVGVGGSEPPADWALESLSPLTRRRITGVQDDLEKLLRQARFQRESYQRLVQVLQQEKLLRDTTPSIYPIDPERGYISSRYGRRIDPFTGRNAMHRGVDFSAPAGTPVLVTADGRVTRASWHGSFGKMVEIDHGNGLLTRYGHMRDVTVKKGQRVHRGDLLGHVGNTGRSTAPHVHYEVIRKGRSQNPLAFIIRE